ncbi:extracellular calcium-sensing receptor-like [Lepisosteus oculatus]|uniref:extracellular calcium-sensing receptor-like n=1 Tax=Lepisosteus oculatus TaxID=7918 RepID=UPI0035F51FF5
MDANILTSLMLFHSIQVDGDLTCRILGKYTMSGLFKNGELVIGGVFPVFATLEDSHTLSDTEPPTRKCVDFDLRVFRWVQMMVFAIEEINTDSSLLPNITLGYKILDNCDSPAETVRAGLTLANGPEEVQESKPCPSPTRAVITSNSLHIARAIGPFGIPLVSYASTCSCLSNKREFPTFSRTIPSDFFQAKALAQLVKHFGWTWIGAIQADNEYGIFGIQSFTKEVAKYGVCIAFTENILSTYSKPAILQIVETIKRTTVKVILAFANEHDLYPLMQEIVSQNITGIQWIASEDWVTAARPSTVEFFRSFGGTIGFATHKMAIPEFKDFLINIHPSVDSVNNLNKVFWENMVMEQLKRVSFVNRFGEAVYFDENGDPPAAYDIINWQLNKGVPAGVCSESCPPGTRRAARKGQPICCFDCIPCADGTMANTTAECMECPQDYWSNDGKDSCILRDTEYLSYYDAMGITLTTVSLFGLCLTVATISVFFSFRSTPIVKANNSELSSLLLFSLLLCFLCPLTFIGQPTAWSCMLRHTAFGITFALCISCVLGKTIVVVTAFRATLPNDNMAKNFGPVQQRIIVFSCTAVQVIICVLWLSLKPPFPDKNFKLSNEKIILECNTGSEIAFYAVLGYIGLLAATCLVLAFLARKLPDNFNEAKLITFSMLIFCAVWVTFIPAYISSPGKYTVAVEIFAILSSTFGLLLCIFAPKCYLILLKPEKNTRKHMMGKVPSKRL